MADRTTRCLLALTFAIATADSSFGAPAFRPDPRSPLATDNLSVFAIAADRQTLLVTPFGKEDWTQLAVIPGADIRGLALFGGRLFFSNRADASIQWLATRTRDRKPVLLYRGLPLVRPTELAYADALIIADPGAGTLFRLPLAAAVEPVPARLPLERDVTDTMFITGWGAGEVLISDSASGLLAQLTATAGDDVKYRPMQQRGVNAGDLTVQWNQTPGKPETLRRQGYPGVEAPAAIAVYNGILYVTDARTGQLFAAGVHDARAIRLELPEPRGAITRLTANPVALTALDANGRLFTFPRLVPSELTLLPGARPQSLAPVIEYLYRRKLLATRRVEVIGTLDETLARVRMTWPARGEPSEPQTREGHYASFCLLNPKYCVNQLPIPTIPPGTQIVMADLYAERFTTSTQVVLDGTQTLGSFADAAIVSDQFRSFTSDEHLRRLNGFPSDRKDSPRDAVRGTFRILQEQVRYVIPIEASEVSLANSEFQELLVRVRPSLRIAPLERTPVKKAGLDDRLHPNDPNCEAARVAMEALLKAINYSAGTPQRTIFVGVAEDVFDAGHTDFVTKANPQGILHVMNDQGELIPAPFTGIATAPPDVEPVTWRRIEKDKDHGTAVAALIAGRTKPYQDGLSLSPALIGMFTQTNDATALAAEIERAMNQSLMTVINLSLGAQREVAKLRNLIELKRNETLFVVAAPNASSQVTLCAAGQVFYPACHGQVLENVMVVGGTTLDGKHVHLLSPTGEAVHIFAPEEGYYSAGRNNSYVPVEGTSFATALVSAAAAILSSDGVTSPGRIRQRLMATATVIDQPGRPQWARLLNIKRALSNINRAVITKSGAQSEGELQNKEVTLSFKIDRKNKTIPVMVGDIRSLRQVPGNPLLFDLAYVVPETKDDPNALEEKLLLQTVNASGANWEVCYLPSVANAAGVRERTCVNLAEVSDYVGPIQ